MLYKHNTKQIKFKYYKTKKIRKLHLSYHSGGPDLRVSYQVTDIDLCLCDQC